MRKSVAESIISTISDLNKSGLVDDITIRNIEQLCLPDV
jgi:putative transcriptional regulator